MFSLILDTLEGLNDSDKHLYSKNEAGKYVLHDKIAKRQNDYGQLNDTKNNEIFKLKEEIRLKDEKLKGLNLPENNDLLQKNEELNNLKKTRDQEVSELKVRLGAFEKQRIADEQKLKTVKLDSLLTQACSKLDVEKDLLKITMGYTADGIPCVMENGTVALTEAGNVKSIEDYVSDLKTHPVFKRAFNVSVPEGVGLKDNFSNINDLSKYTGKKDGHEEQLKMYNDNNEEFVRNAYSKGEAKVKKMFGR